MAKEIKGVNWKPVDYEGSLVNTDLQGLIRFEECVDYETPNIMKKAKKRKLAKVEQNATKNKKKKKKVKQKKTISEFAVSATEPNKGLPLSTEISTVKPEKGEKLIAWSGFGLHPTILRAIEEQGFEQPTKIQELSLPPAVLGRRDILGAAETGSGKTLAFGLPIITGILKIKEIALNNGSMNAIDDQVDEHSIYDVEEDDEFVPKSNIQKPLYALILTPTRELAVQVKNHLAIAAKYTGIQVAVVLGGMAVVKQERILSKGPEIVVATPGRLWELIQEGNPHLSQVDSIRFLAIDETDRMLERGHFKELHSLLERINFDENKRKCRQNFVFSATLTLIHELPKYLLMKKKLHTKNSKNILNLTSKQKLQKIVDILGVTDPKVIDVTQKTGTAESLSECRLTCNINEKDYYVYYFLQKHPGRTLIFCNTIGCVKRLTTLLGLLGCNPLALHASMQQRQRLKNLERFRDDEFGILIATDVAARGLDIPCIEHVLHYQTPRTSESYVHRSGRTARALRQGITILLVEPSELPNYLKLCRTLGRNEDLPIFPVQTNLLNAVKGRVNLARRLDKLDLVVRKNKSEVGWLEKAAADMDILIEDNNARKQESKEAQKCKKAAEIKRKELAKLLAKPLIPKGFSGKYPLSDDTMVNLVQSSEKKSEAAIDVLKGSMNDPRQIVFRKAKWLFKSKTSNSNITEKLASSIKNKKVKQRKRNTKKQ
ncbi:hypothetical protein FQA39_LY10718 [Lamprigera yunnana]|nr:hypothetical protein FQA39_LY10718 [Lamprigera yunnana]